MTKIAFKQLPALTLFLISFITSTTIGNAQCNNNNKPTFGLNFNGIPVANINNSLSDPGESATATLYDGGQYITSGHFHSSLANLYHIAITSSGGAVLVDNREQITNGLLTATQLSGSAGTHLLMLANPGIGGKVIQTITPFTDLNNSQTLDAGDCTGDPIVLTYNVIPKLKPTFGLNFNGTYVANINNGSLDPGESAGVTFCDGGQYFTSGHVHSSASNLYNITVKSSGGTLLFNGETAYGIIMTAAQLTNTATANTRITLANPNAGGTFIQTITPFTDVNNNRIPDAGDITGDPIIITYTVTAKPTWYKDKDGDQRASEIMRSCASPGIGWTLTQLPVNDCNDNDPGPCPNIPPVVTMTSPARATNFVVPGPIYLSAAASDPDGTIQSVDFYNGSTLLFTQFKAPYGGKWYPVPTGNYYVTAVATDNNGLKTTSAPVHITVLHNRPPIVRITSPVNDATYAAPATIVLSAYAIAHGGKIKTVKFYNGSTLIHTENSLPYIWNWENVPAGNYAITAVANDTYGRITVSAPVHFIVAGNCTAASKPTFGLNFNGSAIANINNGTPDPGESASVIVYDGGQYFTSGHFHSSTSNLYNITVTSNGGALLFDSNTASNMVLSASQFTNTAGTHTITLTNPNIGGTFIQTITPFTDLNNNGRPDAGDCVGDAVKLTYTVILKLKPTFGFNFNGTAVANINNGSPDPGESGILSVCDGGQYFTSGHFHSSGSNLYNIAVTSNGGALLFNGEIADNIVMTASQLTGTATANTKITLANPNVGGTLMQTITPFTDINNNRHPDAGDIAGDPIVITYTVTAKPTWYRDNDNDQHASEIMRSCVSPGIGWTLTQLPADDCDDNDPNPCGHRPLSGISAVNGKNSIDATLSLRLAPNPVKNILNIYTTGLQKNKQSTISVISSLGVEIKRIQTTSSTPTIQVNVSSLISGMYTIKIINGDKVIFKPFVKL